MNIHTITVGAFEVNCYLVRISADTAFLVDPGADADVILREIAKRKLRLTAYLLTHGHADHVSALPDVVREYPAPVYVHKADAEWAFTLRNQIPPYYDVPARPNTVFYYVSEGQVYSELGSPFLVIETPGHTPGGVCYFFQNESILFSGDTLFKGTVGRTDLPGGSARILSESLKKLSVLPDNTRVFPGHGLPTTIAMEKKQNMFFRSAM